MSVVETLNVPPASPKLPGLRVAVFDLDGTLIDSIDGIVHSLQHALALCGETPAQPVTRALIGPPLRRLLEILLPDRPATALDAVANAFTAHYDSEGVLQTPVYPGIETYLQTLRQQGVALYILTNKRSTPTHKLLAHLGWQAWFAGVDTTELGATSAAKGVRLAQLLARHNQALAENVPAVHADNCLMVGDSGDDLEAAVENNTAFAAASWGYGNAAARVSSEFATRNNYSVAHSAAALPLRA